jgi:hypothetical protein
MSLKSWYIFIACLISFGTPISFQPAFAADDSFDVLGDDEEIYDEDDGFVNAGDEISFSDSGSDDALTGASNLTLNEGSGLVNVGGFDIAGIMLGMSFDDVHNLYYDNASLYTPRKRNSLVYTIPQDWKYNLDYECRQAGIVQPNKLDKCIRGLARKRGLLYVSEIHLERVKTGETVDVYLTSNATDNVVYRVVYTNDADKKEGTNPKFDDQREKKILSFWKTVIKKYGAPNSGQDTWITSTNSYDPKMTAYFGALELVDEGRHAMDAATAAKQSRENFRAKPYAF